MPRIEKDTLGEVRVPDDALYGAQTQRAVENYPISGLREHPQFIRAFILIKRASAMANRELGALDANMAEAIVAACDLVLAEPDKYRRHFVVDVFQAGAGTSFNMNCNEVLANLANVALGGRIGEYTPIHPNDHVNMAESTNDVFPTALRMATRFMLDPLLLELDRLADVLDQKGAQFGDVIKSGRTHLQDAVPITLGQEFQAYAAAVRRGTRLLRNVGEEVEELGIGGTAVGTGLNTARGFRLEVIRHINASTGLHFHPAPDLREAMQSQLPVVAVSAALRDIALELTRITNDLRLLASGPMTGLAEILLPAVQPGSSIMPGKVNPVIPEVVNQTSFLVIGLDVTVTLAASAGQLQLNVMEPVITFALFASINTMERAVNSLRVNCVEGITANAERTRDMVLDSLGIVTVLKPSLGYKQCAEIAREGYETGKSLHDIVVKERKLLTQEKWEEIFSFENLINPKFEQ
jgi:aspartate ammonia-lyase